MSLQQHLYNESAFVFNCEGSDLVGVVHRSEQESDLGLLAIVAGGPQYRGGCGRQLVELGRALAADGIHVMRFDHRGLGDSSGEFNGFQHLEEDIRVAIHEFRDRIPSVKRIMLWGGCDAASAAMINAYKYPEVVSIVAANPWVTTEETAATARRKHYLDRLKQKSFWLKLLRAEYNVFDYLSGSSKKQPDNESKNTSARYASNEKGNGDFLQAMLEGFLAFRGQVLFLMSGRSITVKQFDALVSSDLRWQKQAHVTRHNIEGADLTFSTAEAREAMLKAAKSWCRMILHNHTHCDFQLEQAETDVQK